MFDLHSLISDTRFIPVSSAPFCLNSYSQWTRFSNRDSCTSKPLRSLRPEGEYEATDPSSNKITLAHGSVRYNLPKFSAALLSS